MSAAPLCALTADGMIGRPLTLHSELLCARAYRGCRSAKLCVSSSSNNLSGLEAINGAPRDQAFKQILDCDNLAKPKATIAPHFLVALSYMAEWRARYPTQCGLIGFGRWMKKGR